MQVLMVGTGEYTVGIPPPSPLASSKVSGSAASPTLNKSDKKLGVVALTMLDLKRRGQLVHWIGMVGTSAEKVEQAKQWLHDGIGKTYAGLDTRLDKCWPDVGTDFHAYKKAIDHLNKGSAVTIFTPDTTHFDIAKYAIEKGMHVMIAKPAVLTTRDHLELVRLAQEHKVLVCVEYHKRFDPIYEDARQQIPQMGFFNYFYAYMSQPKYQLETFKSWAGKLSDISFYLNSHHLDFLIWSLRDDFHPVQVSAVSSAGTAEIDCGCVEGTEDTITLLVTFQHRSEPKRRATAVFTSSWVAPNKAEVHSQQRFHYLGSNAELRIDQAHRGYELTSDDAGYQSKNPLFMKYQPSANTGMFCGQGSYGYKSFQVWLEVCAALNAGKVAMFIEDEYQMKLEVKQEWMNLDLPVDSLATIQQTIPVTRVLEAGWESLRSKSPVNLDLHPQK